MMNKKETVLGITMGNNKGNLFGSENDAILFYNLFYSFYLKEYNDIVWLEPKILLNKQVTINNLLNLIDNTSINKLIIYFSGHGYRKRLKFFDENIINDKFFNSINQKIKNIDEIILILDCCYSGSFFIDKKYAKINNIKYLTACNKNQKCNEGLVNFNKENFIHKNPQKINKLNNIIIGIFSYNLFKLLKNKNMYNPNKWLSTKKSIIWTQIEKLAKQTFTIFS
jgi:hypothetical protein